MCRMGHREACFKKIRKILYKIKPSWSGNVKTLWHEGFLCRLVYIVGLFHVREGRLARKEIIPWNLKFPPFWPALFYPLHQLNKGENSF